MQFILNPEIKNLGSFDQVMQLRGEVYRELENRCTQRITFNSQNYFLKQHFGVGWREILKNLLQLRLPITSAQNEWRAIQRLQQLSIPTLEIVGYGNQGMNPARRKSFLLTRELTQFITLEDFCKKWSNQPPSFHLKHSLIQKMASITRTLHENGINHRDFYICHFLLDLIQYSKGLIKLYLIDLHRAHIRKKVPSRWAIKDLAGLYFSSKDIGLTQRDLLRFIKIYRQQSLRTVFKEEKLFWKKVKKRGDKLHQQHSKC